MQQELEIGKDVWLKLPYGHFIIDSCVKPEQDVILIAGGTGISPFLSFLAGAIQNRKNQKNPSVLRYTKS
ncbi:MAG: hypothetical protein GF398_10465, partial [Chitinivibrionales bacterium]|nr:hypothetical protein [Chitinivibrionales bacterium]